MSTHFNDHAIELVERLKESDLYSSFKSILDKKTKNEEAARRILMDNEGKLNVEHLKEIIWLVDTPYPCLKDGKIDRHPWFGRLLKPNALNIFNEDAIRINKWFNLAFSNNIHEVKKIDHLCSDPYKIKGINVGFITLILYLIDKPKYLIWFRSQHDGLRIVDTGIHNYTGRSEQYPQFNEAAKKFACKFGFNHTELDWVFSTGLNKAL